jgi:hypothetical protein
MSLKSNVQNASEHNPEMTPLCLTVDFVTRTLAGSRTSLARMRTEATIDEIERLESLMVGLSSVRACRFSGE